jgi:hypothetical protein
LDSGNFTYLLINPFLLCGSTHMARTRSTGTTRRHGNCGFSHKTLSGKASAVARLRSCEVREKAMERFAEAKALSKDAEETFNPYRPVSVLAAGVSLVLQDGKVEIRGARHG